MASSRHRRHWDDLSALDPDWAILSEDERRFGGGDRESFTRSGIVEVDDVLGRAARYGVPYRRDHALDFGCGAGRLTQALAQQFERCLGVDISEHMVEIARARVTDRRCSFSVLDDSGLDAFESDSFDLVLSRLVLQHVVSPQAKLRYISQLTRVLRPGGLLALQLPSRIPWQHRLQPVPRAYAALRMAGAPREFLYRRLHLHPIRLTAVGKPLVAETIRRSGGTLLGAEDEVVAGGVVSTDYFATKGGETPSRAPSPHPGV